MTDVSRSQSDQRTTTKAGKKVFDKDASWWGPLLAIALGLIGGLVRLLQGWRGGRLRTADYINAGIDLFGSAFITIVAYLLVKWGLTVWLGPAEIHEIAAVGVGGLAGHIGVRASVLALEQYLTRRFK